MKSIQVLLIVTFFFLASLTCNSQNYKDCYCYTYSLQVDLKHSGEDYFVISNVQYTGTDDSCTINQIDFENYVFDYVESRYPKVIDLRSNSYTYCFDNLGKAKNARMEELADNSNGKVLEVTVNFTPDASRIKNNSSSVSKENSQYSDRKISDNNSRSSGKNSSRNMSQNKENYLPNLDRAIYREYPAIKSILPKEGCVVKLFSASEKRGEPSMSETFDYIRNVLRAYGGYKASVNGSPYGEMKSNVELVDISYNGTEFSLLRQGVFSGGKLPKDIKGKTEIIFDLASLDPKSLEISSKSEADLGGGILLEFNSNYKYQLTVKCRFNNCIKNQPIEFVKEASVDAELKSEQTLAFGGTLQDVKKIKKAFEYLLQKISCKSNKANNFFED
ncbi:hypothetical protein [Winogradskyella vincentii]|uniref:Uncharacterized protein n=1 Tax=Winogradskyella vincentii TaxID=2877122 RepID=A0ABS7Y3N5_9FLAO|nr:hypothetical protein [Winogradskyella vincentii]MCA0154531.1 hypothetical protein [Winogradskyella vincentii]